MDRPREHARILVAQGRYDLALEAYAGVLATEPEDPEALHGMAACLLALERPEEAAGEAQRLLGLVPDEPEALLLLARIRLAQDRPQEARTLVEDARGLVGEDGRVEELSARIHLVGKRWRQALEATEAGLRLDPDDNELLNLRSLALARLGRRDEAEAAMARSLHIDPEDPHSHAHAGWNRLHAGDHRAARRHFVEALRLAPGNEYARAGLLESIKARNPLYRWLLAILLKLESLRSRTFMAVMVASVVVRYGALRLAETHPGLTVPAYLLVFGIFGLFMALMIAPTLANAALLVHPLGRHALTGRERWQSLAVLAGMLPVLAGLVLMIVAAGGWRDIALEGVILAALLLVPLVAATSPARLVPWSRLALVAVTAVFAGLISAHLGIECHRQRLLDDSQARVRTVGLDGLEAITPGLMVTPEQKRVVDQVVGRINAAIPVHDLGRQLGLVALWGLVAFTWAGNALVRRR